MEITQNDIKIGQVLPVNNPFDNKPVEMDTNCQFNSECGQTKSYLCMIEKVGETLNLCKYCLKQYAATRIEEDQYVIEGKLPNTNCGKPIKWIATSRSGSIIGFAEKPKILLGHWSIQQGIVMRHDSKVLENVQHIAGPWKKSLRKVVKK